MIDLETLCDVAAEAGRAILDVYASPKAVWIKEDQSPLTQADLQAHDVISSQLERLFPGIPVWSEEGAIPAAPHARFFLVDPLDGTKEFLKRNGEFTVNIALIEDGAPVAGVVHAPALGQLYYAARGAGAFRRDPVGDTRLHTCAPDLSHPLRVIGSRSHAGEELDSWLQRLDRPYTFVAAGSSLKFCRLAEGAADVYPRHSPTCQWDTAAGQAILECAGGAVLDAQGRDLRYGVDRAVLNPFFVALAMRDMNVPPLH